MRKKWTEEEINFIKFAYPHEDTKVIANELGRTVSAVMVKATRLNLKKEKEIFPKGYKRCAKCKTLLPLECFNKDNRSPDGKKAYCKDCSRKGSKKADEIENNNIPKYNKCIICGKLKPITDFSKDKKMKNGYLNQCKDCRNAKNKVGKIERLKKRGY